MSINATWHRKHLMPKPATTAQRIAWHRAHAQHCSCRPIPASLQALMRTAEAAPAGTLVDPFQLAGAFVQCCLERGWLVRQGRGAAASYYATTAGERALARLGITLG